MTFIYTDTLCMLSTKTCQNSALTNHISLNALMYTYWQFSFFIQGQALLIVTPKLF